MSVNIKGLKELEKNINAELTSRKASRVMNGAVNAGGDKVVSNLKNEFSKYRGTGYSTGATSDEIVRSNARLTAANVRMLKVGWNGPKERYRLVHLNEFGYTRKGFKYTPRMFGAIEKTVRSSQDDYFDTVYKEMRRNYER